MSSLDDREGAEVMVFTAAKDKYFSFIDRRIVIDHATVVSNVIKKIIRSNHIRQGREHLRRDQVLECLEWGIDEGRLRLGDFSQTLGAYI